MSNTTPPHKDIAARLRGLRDAMDPNMKPRLK